MTEKKGLFAKLSNLAKRLEDYAKSGTYGELERAAEKDPQMQKIREAIGGRDPTDVLSPSGLAGFTKSYAKRAVKRAMERNPDLLPHLEKEIVDLLKVIEATPERAIKHIRRFYFQPDRSSLGGYSKDILSIHPYIEDRHFITPPLPAIFAHEAGHGASLPMLGHLIEMIGKKRYGFKPTRDWYFLSGTGERAYPQHYLTMEGIAEYLGRHIQRQAGLKPFPYFGHGPGQESIYEELMRIGGKNPQNPWFVVYSYLRDVIP